MALATVDGRANCGPRIDGATMGGEIRVVTVIVENALQARIATDLNIVIE